ncbi:MAG: NB-ARC domain-containing protein [Chloroflexota bacterium]
MAKLVPKLGKLSLAILEHFVGSKLGKEFLDELREDYEKAGVIVAALEATERRFPAEFADKGLSKAMFVDLSQKDYPPLKVAVAKFYDHPTDPAFPDALQEILLGEFRQVLATERINEAVVFYVRLLTEELALVDENFRENVQALANLRGEQSQREMVEILRRVEQLLARQKPTDVPDIVRNLHQLPPTPADFVERKDELNELRASLRDAKGAAISGLTGMGGIGKTVLALFIAHELAKDYPDAQIFLDLKGTTTPLTPTDAMRHVLYSFEPTADLRALYDVQLATHFQGLLTSKKVLIFWDNARSAKQVKPLLPPSSCAVLITSRWQFPLPGLKSVQLGVMKDKEAEAFLLELCPRIDGSAGELARQCGCLPLALRIAGSFLAVNADWSLPEYLERLNAHRLETLKAPEDTELDLEVVFAQSYDTLSEDERRRWRALAVFPTSFDRAAAAAVWDLDAPAAHDLLSCLCRYSLLDFLPSPKSGRGTGGERGRYSLHDLLRDFALTCLNKEEKETANEKHAGHYSGVLALADDLYLKGGENILAGLALFDREAEHIKIGHE